MLLNIVENKITGAKLSVATIYMYLLYVLICKHKYKQFFFKGVLTKCKTP